MPTQEEWEDMLNKTAEQRFGPGFGQRSRFYGRDSESRTHTKSEHTESHYTPPPARNYMLRPIATPGVQVELQERALNALRVLVHQVGAGEQLYFHGDRVNLFEQGFAQEPPLLAGRLCKVSQTGYMQQGLLRIPVFKVAQLPENWIDGAYFGREVPVIKAM